MFLIPPEFNESDEDTRMAECAKRSAERRRLAEEAWKIMLADPGRHSQHPLSLGHTAVACADDLLNALEPKPETKP